MSAPKFPVWDCNVTDFVDVNAFVAAAYARAAAARAVGAPVASVAPTVPVALVSPVAPTVPVALVASIDPTVPVDPVASVDPTALVFPTDPDAFDKYIDVLEKVYEAAKQKFSDLRVTRTPENIAEFNKARDDYKAASRIWLQACDENHMRKMLAYKSLVEEQRLEEEEAKRAAVKRVDSVIRAAHRKTDIDTGADNLKRELRKEGTTHERKCEIGRVLVSSLKDERYQKYYFRFMDALRRDRKVPDAAKLSRLIIECKVSFGLTKPCPKCRKTKFCTEHQVLARAYVTSKWDEIHKA
jgi:hypothetical protein